MRPTGHSSANPPQATSSPQTSSHHLKTHYPYASSYRRPAWNIPHSSASTKTTIHRTAPMSVTRTHPSRTSVPLNPEMTSRPTRQTEGRTREGRISFVPFNVFWYCASRRVSLFPSLPVSLAVASLSLVRLLLWRTGKMGTPRGWYGEEERTKPVVLKCNRPKSNIISLHRPTSLYL